MDVLIFYEHKVREYPACCALRAELKRRGISSAICHNGGPGIWRHRIFSLPSVAIGPSALEVPLGKDWTCLNNYTDYLRGTARYFINLQVEQVFPDGDGEQYSIVRGNVWRDKIIYMCWGEKRRQQLLRQGVPEEQIGISGAIHLDFLSSPLDRCYYSREDLAKLYRLDAEKRWVLFISSYTYAEMTQENQEWIAKVQERSGQMNPSAAIRRAVEISTRSRELTLCWFERYLSECEDSIFIYRPHPGERISAQMERMNKKFPGRFVIISSEPLQNWILASDTVDLWISTAIVDLWKVKKHCRLLHPVAPPEGFVPVTMDCSAAIHTYEGFKQAHRENPDGKGEPFPGKKEELERYYLADSVPSYQKICDRVEELLRKAPPSAVRSKFTLGRLMSLHHIRQMALAFFAFCHVRPSRFSPVFRNKLRRMEDIALEEQNVFFTDSEKKACQKIYKAILNDEN